MPTHCWRWEKAETVVTSVCRTLDDHPGYADADGFAYLWLCLYDGLKLYCDAVGSHYGEDINDRWDGDLVEYLWRNPGKVDETLELLGKKGFCNKP